VRPRARRTISRNSASAPSPRRWCSSADRSGASPKLARTVANANHADAGGTTQVAQHLSYELMQPALMQLTFVNQYAPIYWPILQDHAVID
jgi:hypothetical protein